MKFFSTYNPTHYPRTNMSLNHLVKIINQIKIYSPNITYLTSIKSEINFKDFILRTIEGIGPLINKPLIILSKRFHLVPTKFWSPILSTKQNTMVDIRSPTKEKSRIYHGRKVCGSYCFGVITCVSRVWFLASWSCLHSSIKFHLILGKNFFNPKNGKSTL